MAEQPFLVMTQQQAARFREDTAHDANRLDPRKIEAGPNAGKYALPRRVMFDPAFESHRDAFNMLTEVAMDPDTVWPAEDE